MPKRIWKIMKSPKLSDLKNYKISKIIIIIIIIIVANKNRNVGNEIRNVQLMRSNPRLSSGTSLIWQVNRLTLVGGLFSSA